MMDDVCEGGKREEAHVIGDDLGRDDARVEAWLLEVGVLVGDAWPAELGAGDAVCPGNVSYCCLS
jgi:hypothetical protein